LKRKHSGIKVRYQPSSPCWVKENLNQNDQTQVSNENILITKRTRYYGSTYHNMRRRQAYYYDFLTIPKEM
jgi:hypothetical protein